MGRVYLIRYGMARVVSRFQADSETFDRGQTVVIRTHRGTELGEVLAEAALASTPEGSLATILREAQTEDLERAQEAKLDRAAHFQAVQAVFQEGTWPLEVIDTEPLLEPGRTVLHYLGPHQLDISGIVASFRSRFGLEIVLEPAGRDLPMPEPEPVAEPEPQGCGSCGSSGSCGDCGGCSVKVMVAERRRTPVNA